VEARASSEAPTLDVARDDPEDQASGEVVRAAGGIVIRRNGDQLEVLLVHRPRGDWSFPKGKADQGESDEHTAVREVEEETGLRCGLAGEAGLTRYTDAAGRAKIVHYWFMEPSSIAHDFTPNHEIDDLRWCLRAEADKLLSYAPDRRLLSSLPEDVL
jgi:8-oxo-dGTP pyrophosphatase MutT (NUDIX family)